MTEQLQKHSGGRPRLHFDLRQVEELARIGCIEEDMAAVLGVSVDTLQRRKRDSEEFCGAIKRGQAATRNSLRRLQLKKALEGNVTMLIWLGKQLLGQSDRQALEHTGPGGERLGTLREVLAEKGFTLSQVLALMQALAQAEDQYLALPEPQDDPAKQDQTAHQVGP